MKKKCAKCQVEFECKVDNIQNCHCQHVKITKAQLVELGKDFMDCLCPNCLKEYTED